MNEGNQLGQPGPPAKRQRTGRSLMILQTFLDQLALGHFEAMHSEETELRALKMMTPEQQQHGQSVPFLRRTGSAKDRLRMKWATQAAGETGEDAQVARLSSLSQSKLKRLISRQQDRLTCKRFKRKMGRWRPF